MEPGLIPAKVEIAVACVVFGMRQEEGIMVALIQRTKPPFEGRWVLPGGYLMANGENCEEAAKRELEKDTGLTGIALNQVYFTDGVKNPLVSVVLSYYGIIPKKGLESAIKRKNPDWFPLKSLPELAYNHDQIINTAFERLKTDMVFAPVFKNLLPERFPLSDLQSVFETIFECTFDKSNFRKRILDSRLVEDAKEYEENVSHRAARLYQIASHLKDEKRIPGLLGFLGSLLYRRVKL